mgnify:CR=1 FL=1
MEKEKYIIKPSELSYKCDHCDKTFVDKSQLKIHVENVHEGVKHTCKKCGKSFTLKSNLSRHLSVNHGDLKIECEYCGKMISKYNIQKIQNSYKNFMLVRFKLIKQHQPYCHH